MKVLLLCGSLQKKSSNQSLLKLVAQRAPHAVETVTTTLLGELPHFNADLDGETPPAPVQQWRATLAAVDALVISAPEYALGTPGVLKNALDWVVGSGEFHQKPMVVTCAAQGAGRGVNGLAMLMQSLRAVDARVLLNQPLVVPRACLDDNGNIHSETVERDVDGLWLALTAALPG